MDSSSPKEQYVTEVTDNYETTCWGCGLSVLIPSCASVFKCGWCGAITDQNTQKRDQKGFRWRVLRDRCFVSVVIIFMLFVIFGGVWAIYPVLFSISLLLGSFHSIITAILSIATISSFSLAAFRCAGTPPNILWGSYPTVGKGDLENYTFCHYCLKPKSPRAHHCRSCRKCILDMDHHCPFIGNCVGAANHRNFIAFLISAVLSTIYVSIMSAYAGLHIWPTLTYSIKGLNGITSVDLAWRVINEILIAFLRSALLLSSRGLVLAYLFIASVSLQIGLSVLLWQQLSYIYQGKTYLSHLTSQAGNEEEKKDCQNLVRFFGFQYSVTRFLPTFRVTRKRHVK
ncbi:protein S-acyltransferase 11 [Gastrolobium bilobum]|uniref:protein S-acyltransferase 11 n=1 Tax=Gastrolobium bilobum TaxID=150636 RepID=UPI002AB26DA8|nr:protein S-acyltransferase 11 [Gastrolobium bilobum]